MSRRINREYKSTLFVLVFGNRKEDLLELFNAVNNTSYQNAEEIEYNTLDSDRGFFVRLKNDLSFLIDRTMGVYEHQSSPASANITVRMLHYYSDLLREMIDLKTLYREKEVQIPSPQFDVFYNGRQDQEDEIIFRLSDLFERKEDKPEIDLRVRMLNINAGRNPGLMKKCVALAQYSEVVRRIREALYGRHDQEQRRLAVIDVIDTCIENDILADVLREHRDEVTEMYYWEYNEEAHRWAIEKDAEERGEARGACLELIQQITKKVKKDKTLEQTAEDLEQDLEKIKPIWEAVKSEAPDYDEKKILKRLGHEESKTDKIWSLTP